MQTVEYRVKPKPKVAFKSASMAKSVLGKAGRSKPQGDLIVYFSKDSCAAEGYNSAGVTTLELDAIGGKRQIESYESSIEEDTIMGVKFPYQFHFRALFSKKDGLISAEDAKSATIDYGVTEHEKPYLAINFASGKIIEVRPTKRRRCIQGGRPNSTRVSPKHYIICFKK